MSGAASATPAATDDLDAARSEVHHGRTNGHLGWVGAGGRLAIVVVPAGSGAWRAGCVLVFHFPGCDGQAACTDVPPSDSRFRCKPTYAEQLEMPGCYRAGSCGGLFITVWEPQFSRYTCVYDAEGVLAWASTCTDHPAYCSHLCLDSAGAPSVWAGCSGMPNTCDGGTDALQD